MVRTQTNEAISKIKLLSYVSYESRHLRTKFSLFIFKICQKTKSSSNNNHAEKEVARKKIDN